MFLVELIVVGFQDFFDDSVAIVADEIFKGRFPCNKALRGHIVHKLAQIELAPLLALVVYKRAEASDAAYDVLKRSDPLGEAGEVSEDAANSWHLVEYLIGEVPAVRDAGAKATGVEEAKHINKTYMLYCWHHKATGS